MNKTLLICAMAACVAGCTEQKRHDDYVMGYQYVPAYTNTCGCNTCGTTTTTCNTCLHPVLHQQQPKTIVVMVPPAPQPIVEQEIIYEPQPTCGCHKCGCKKKAAK